MPSARWKVNTGGLLEEILSNNQMDALRKPIWIFATILEEVARRANKLNDPQLNALMARLQLYGETDPECPEYDQRLTHRIIHRAERLEHPRAQKKPRKHNRLWR